MPKAKKKDFNKAKLKVGKSKPKATSHTDTSFVSKTVHLPNQSVVNSTSVSFEHYLMLCKHHSSNTRKEALVYLQSQAHAHVVNLKPLFTATAPLIVDPSKAVRDTLVHLYSNTPEIRAKIPSFSGLIILYVHSAMTHISPEIRSQSTQFLDLLLETDAFQVVRKSWGSTLQCFLPLLGWEADGLNAESAKINVSLSYGSNMNKIRASQLQSLDKLLHAGLEPDTRDDNAYKYSGPSRDTSAFALSCTSSPYLHIGLFKTSNNSLISKNEFSSSSATEDRQSRLDFIRQNHLQTLNIGLKNTCREAGQVGRIAKSTLTFLNQTA